VAGRGPLRERDLRLERPVARAVDRAHAPAAERPHDPGALAQPLRDFGRLAPVVDRRVLPAHTTSLHLVAALRYPPPMRKLLVVCLLASPALAQEPDWNKIQIRATKVAGNVYMLDGASDVAGRHLRALGR